MSRLGLRARLTLLAAGVVALALVLGGVATAALLERNLEDNLDRSLDQQAADRARLLDEGAAPDALVDSRLREAFVWIGTVEGEPVAVGGAVRPLEAPPTDPGSPRTVDLTIEELSEPGEGPEQYAFRVARAATSDGATVVVAAAQIEEVDDAVGEVTRILVVAIPVLVALVAAVTWFAIGRALQPVEAIRRKADAISGAHLDERVPVPASQDEIRDLAETMNEMLDRLDVHQQAMQRFTADASHELKSPVANIRTMVETASVDDPRWSELRLQLTTESDRLAGLVENLLYLASHDDASAPPLDRTIVDVDELLFAEAEMLTATTTRRIDISGVEPVQVSGDPVALRRLVRNLVDNAARHASSSVRLEAGASETTVTVRVIDDGPGIAPERRAAVFERFTRLDDGRAREGGGTGLGLAIARSIADAHGGHIEIEDVEHGTSVRVDLPSIEG